MDTQKTKIAERVLRQNYRATGIMLHDFRLYYKTTIITIVWTSTNTDTQHQWNRREHPEINPHTYSQLFCNKEGKNTQ